VRHHEANNCHEVPTVVTYFLPGVTYF